MPPTEPDIPRWIRDAGAGDREAFGRLYDHFERLFWKIAWKYANGDPELARDIFQSILLKLLSVRENFPPDEAGWKTWAAAVARNAAVDALRKQRAQKAVRGAPVTALPDDDCVVAAAEPESPFPPNALEEIKAFVATLSREEQEVFRERLRDEDRSFREISATLQANAATLRTRYHRLLEKIRDEMRRTHPDYFDDPPPAHDRSGASEPSQEPTDEL